MNIYIYIHIYTYIEICFTPPLPPGIEDDRRVRHGPASGALVIGREVPQIVIIIIIIIIIMIVVQTIISIILIPMIMIILVLIIIILMMITMSTIIIIIIIMNITKIMIVRPMGVETRVPTIGSSGMRCLRMRGLNINSLSTLNN